MTARSVSVGVVNHNGESYLMRTLRAVERLGSAVDDVLLIDSGSTDRGAALVREHFPQVRVIELGANLGPGAARNRAIREAAHDRVLLIDNDVEPQPGCLAALAAALDGHANAILAMAAVLYEQAPDTVQYVGAYPHFLGAPALLHADTPVARLEDGVRVVGTAITCCLMVDRARFGDRRWFDERLFFYLEDHEFGLRATLQGFDCLTVPERPVPAPGGHDRRVDPRDRALHSRPGAPHHSQSLADGPDAVPDAHPAPVRAGTGGVRGAAAARRAQEGLDRPLALGGWIRRLGCCPHVLQRAPSHADEPATRGPRDPQGGPFPLQQGDAPLRAGARGAARPRPGRRTSTGAWRADALHDASLRIAMVAACPFPWPRGTPIRIHRIAEAVARRGHAVHVVTYHLGAGSGRPSLRRPSDPLTFPPIVGPSPGPTVRKLLLLDPMLARLLRRLHQETRFDVVHAHHYEGLLVASHALRERRSSTMPIPCWPASCPPIGSACRAGWVRAVAPHLDRHLPRRADRTIAVSETIRDALVSLGASAPERCT